MMLTTLSCGAVPEEHRLISRISFLHCPPANEPIEMEVISCSNVANWFQS